uniref:Peptidase C1A papain C-terminal domain-containing protein n=1 Tax=Zooxanthella nutricula TaxID=1333877 RepID=A0A7S2L497_9DINO
MAAPIHADEHQLLLEEGAQPAGGAGRKVRGLVAAGALLGLAAAGTAASFAGAFSAQHPGVATSSAAQRGLVAEFEDTGIFGNLSAFLEFPRGIGSDGLSKATLEGMFDGVMEKTGASSNLTKSEAAAYKGRFVDAVLNSAGDSAMETAQTAIMEEKPVMPEKMAAAINAADLGYTVKPVATTVAAAKVLLGLRVPRDLKLEQPARTRAVFPETFDAREAWPRCAGVIGRVYNQGHCGSCWAFSALQALDSALCIADPRFNESDSSLSRGFTASCVYDRDGCQGGYPPDAWEYVQDTGSIPSTACVPYFAEGAGSEHFQKNGHSPECPSTCATGSGLSWSSSLYRPLNAGLGGAEYSSFRYMKKLLFERGPVSMGMPASFLSSYKSGVWSAGCGTQPNHAVTAIGYSGDDYVVVMNSWGAEWGDKGTFKGDPCVISVFWKMGKIDMDAKGYVFASA